MTTRIPLAHCAAAQHGDDSAYSCQCDSPAHRSSTRADFVLGGDLGDPHDDRIPRWDDDLFHMDGPDSGDILDAESPVPVTLTDDAIRFRLAVVPRCGETRSALGDVS